MDVIIETKRGDNWELEIGFFDTVLEIKDKIQKYHGIPVSLQTLFFNGAPLADDRNTEDYIILQGSRIQLDVAPEPGMPMAEDASVQAARISVNAPTSERVFIIQANSTDTIGRLKERVQEAEGFPACGCGLFLGNMEMQDNHTVAHYGLGGENLVVNVVPRRCPLPSGAAWGAKKVRVMVALPRNWTSKIAVEVNTTDNVSELRKELQRLQRLLHFRLPQTYFFIHKQNVMEEDHTFRWHQVRHNDTIDAFPGWVTGGS